ncbi:MAG TPA: response regulator transcription factor [Thiotrichales bacterium]|nr:response regulator transcription factor [Thiotrichales bacterium]
MIADDHQIVRDGLKAALQQPGLVELNGIAVVAEAENGFEALAEVKNHEPDVLILDISMPLAGGAEVVTDIKRWSPATRIVILTGIDAPGLICSLLETGIDGIFSKGASLDELYKQLPLILRGGKYIAEQFVETMQRQQNNQTLTERELQTLNMIIAGKTSREIADIMSISPKTVDKHRTSLMKKLNIHSVAELMAYALREGLVDPASTFRN